MSRPVDPETILVAAAASTRQAHRIESAESFFYRKSAGLDWTPAVTGLPRVRGTTISGLASHTRDPGVFYACNNQVPTDLMTPEPRGTDSTCDGPSRIDGSACALYTSSMMTHADE